MNSLWKWWQELPLGFDGVFFSIGGFEVQYYGLMYLVGFAFCYGLLMLKLKKEGVDFISKNQLEDLLFGLMAGVIIGGRIGYVFLYDLRYYLGNPLEIVVPFRDGMFVGLSGMSFHGGVLACLLYGWYFIRKEKIDFWKTSDLIISVAPLGYFWGRVGNFLNNELYGRVTDSSIGMYFLDDPSNLRHPSQLYQGVLEGLVLFVVLQYFYKQQKRSGFLLGIGIIWFGVMRFMNEFFREPDAHIGIVLGLSRGQFLSFGLIGLGVVLILSRSSQQLNK